MSNRCLFNANTYYVTTELIVTPMLALKCIKIIYFVLNKTLDLIKNKEENKVIHCTHKKVFVLK